MVSSAAPTSTTNITGFFMSVRGFSLANESQNARVAIFASQIDLLFFFVWVWAVIFSISLESLARIHQQVFQNRAQAEGGEKGQSANDQNHGDEQSAEERCCHRKGTQRLRHVLLSGQTPANCKNRDDHEKAA